MSVFVSEKGFPRNHCGKECPQLLFCDCYPTWCSPCHHRFLQARRALDVDDFSEIILQTLEAWFNLVIVVQRVEY
jgi:hypothetical protein